MSYIQSGLSQKLKFDFVVLGAGSGGCAAAAAIAKALPKATVALMEAGGQDGHWSNTIPAFTGLPMSGRFPFGRYNWDFNSAPCPAMHGKKIFFPRGRLLGGSSSINAMVYIRGHPNDYDHWAKTAGAGWNYASVLPYFRNMENNTRGESDAHGANGGLYVSDCKMNDMPLFQQFFTACDQMGLKRCPDFNAGDDEGYGAYQSTTREGQRCNAFEAHVRTAVASGCQNISVFTNVAATKLLMNAEGNAVTGVRLASTGASKKLDKQNYVDVSCGNVITALGAMQTPHLLLLSGLGPKDQLEKYGIPVIQNIPAVGQHLKDHPDCVFVSKTKKLTTTLSLSPRNLARHWPVQLGKYAQNHGGLLACAVTHGGFFRTDSKLIKPDCQYHFVAAPIEDHTRKMVFYDGFTIHCCMLYPESEGSISLQSADPSVAPHIDANFLSCEKDVQIVSECYKFNSQFLSQKAWDRFGCYNHIPGKFETDAGKIREWVKRNSDTSYHPIGTCRMGKSGEGCVVDERCRVQGVNNLRIMDASIMPEIVGGNTNAASQMIGARAADFLLEDLRIK